MDLEQAIQERAVKYEQTVCGPRDDKWMDDNTRVEIYGAYMTGAYDFSHVVVVHPSDEAMPGVTPVAIEEMCQALHEMYQGIKDAAERGEGVSLWQFQWMDKHKHLLGTCRHVVTEAFNKEEACQKDGVVSLG